MKRKLPFDPTPQKVLPNAGNNENVLNRKQVVGPVNKGAKKASNGAPEESFALNFSTFIDAKKPTSLDLTVSPASFDLSYEMPPSSEDLEDEEVSMAAGGITATTFVLENKVQKISEPAVATEKLRAAQLEAVRQREESESQLKEVEAEVRRLRETIDKNYEPAPAVVDVVKPALQSIVQHKISQPEKPVPLSRLATEELIKRSNAPTDFRSAHSTTDLKQMRSHRVGLDDDAKRARLNALRALGTSAGVSSKHSEPILPAHHPIDAADPRARMKSRPEKLKMLRAVSKLEPQDVQLSTSTLETGLTLDSPSALIAAGNRKAHATNPLASLKWAGDGSSSASSHEEEEEEVVEEIKTTTVPASSAALFRKIEPSVAAAPPTEVTIRVPLEFPAADETHDSEEQSESMDEQMIDQTALEQSMMPGVREDEFVRHSIFVAPAPVTAPATVAAAVAASKSLLDVNLDQATNLQATAHALDQLEYVTKDAKLAGLFGEHLKGEREDAMWRILDDINEFQSIKSASERLSLARSVFQMYLSDSAARENVISKATVSEELRVEIKSKIRAELCDVELFTPIVSAIKVHLATREIPKFVTCDLYRTLGFKKAKGKKKPLAQEAFQQPVVAAVVDAAAAIAVAPAQKVQPNEEEEVDEEEESSDASPAPKAVSQKVESKAPPVNVPSVAVSKPAVVAVAAPVSAAIPPPAVAAVSVAKLAAVAKAAPVRVAPAKTAPVKVAVVPEKVAAKNVTKVVAAPPKPAVAAAAAAVSAPVLASVKPVVEELDATMDEILTNPEQLEHFLSFVESSDKKAAERTGANVVFLQKVAQFNKAEPSDRPKVARTIYDAFLADNNNRRDQKEQVEVDVSELRKRQLVSRFVSSIEQPTQGMFDKAAKDVEAFVEPQLTKFNAAKRNGSLSSAPVTTAAVSKVTRVVAAASTSEPKIPLAASAVAAPSTVSAVSIPAKMTLGQLLEQSVPDAAIVSSFLSYAKDVGRFSPALYLERVLAFRVIDNATARTVAASAIMEEFVSKTGAHVLAIPEHIRSGPEGRWVIFSKRNMIKADFFDSITSEVVKQLDAEIWPRFVASNESKQVQQQQIQPVQVPKKADSVEVSTSSVLSESSHFDDESMFGMGVTLQRGEIEAEMLRRLREEACNKEDDSDSGMEDSPDVPATVRTVQQSARARDLDISPTTAADLLSRLEAAEEVEETMVAAVVAPRIVHAVPVSSADDTVVISKKKPAPVSAEQVFAEQVFAGPVASSAVPRATIPVQRGASLGAPGPAKRMVSGVWPSREGRLSYGEAIEGKRQNRFVVLKNKSLYVWKSESDYRKNKDPSKVLDMDNLCGMTLVREQNQVGGTKWTLRLNFDDLKHAIIFGSDSQQLLQEWKRDFSLSSPHMTM